MSTKPSPKPIIWIGSSLEDLREFPEEVRGEIGYALYLAQIGGKHPITKPLKGFSGAGVLEIFEDYDGDTYRVVYTVKLAGFVYVLHAFQKKSKTALLHQNRILTQSKPGSNERKSIMRSISNS